jgi:hypothetical protein
MWLPWEWERCCSARQAHGTVVGLGWSQQAAAGGVAAEVAKLAEVAEHGSAERPIDGRVSLHKTTIKTGSHTNEAGM